VEGGIPKVTVLNPTGAPDIEASGLFNGTGPAIMEKAVAEAGTE